MEKKILIETLFFKTFDIDDGYRGGLTWGEVKTALKKESFELQDDHILEIEWDGESGEWHVEVTGKRLGTDEELDKRIASAENFKKIQNSIEYQKYLRLKEKFEPKTDEE